MKLFGKELREKDWVMVGGAAAALAAAVGLAQLHGKAGPASGGTLAAFPGDNGSGVGGGSGSNGAPWARQMDVGTGVYNGAVAAPFDAHPVAAAVATPSHEPAPMTSSPIADPRSAPTTGAYHLDELSQISFFVAPSRSYDTSGTPPASTIAPERPVPGFKSSTSISFDPRFGLVDVTKGAGGTYNGPPAP